MTKTSLPHLSPGIIHLLTIVLFGLISLFLIWTFKPFASAGDDKANVRNEVTDALKEANSTARVIVTFEKPKALENIKNDKNKLKDEISKGRGKVVESLPSGKEYKIHYIYQSVPALAMQIDSEALEKLSKNPRVVDISLDGQSNEALFESVPLINADYVNNVGYKGNGSIVAILDTGVDTDHSDISGSIVYEACFTSSYACPPAPHVAEDDNGHGTMVAGIITSDGKVAKKGVASDAKIAAYRVVSPGSLSGYISDWIAALDDIIVNHPEVDVVNMSLASKTPCPVPSLEIAISTLRNMGVPTFVASGNWGEKNNLYAPACIGSAISVGAVYDSNLDSVKKVDTVPTWSSSGDSLDLLAPGAVITSSTIGGGVGSNSGTSLAAPHVSAVAALLKESFPSLTVDEIEQRMKASGKPITDDLADTDPNTNRTTPRINATVALGGDTDRDGCKDLAERQTAVGSEKFGGRRNPNNFWDFYDTNRDGAVSGVDINQVLGRFGSSGDKTIDPLSSPPPAPAYHTRFDRGPGSGPNLWNIGPADGGISGVDFFRVQAQFGHICK